MLVRMSVDPLLFFSGLRAVVLGVVFRAGSHDMAGNASSRKTK